MACDACVAAINHAHLALWRAEQQQNRRGQTQLNELQVIELLDEKVCQFGLPASKGGKLLDVSPGSVWHDYGVKLVDAGPLAGQLILDGPGLPNNSRLSGVTATGASTLPGRLSRRCSEIVAEIGELELYERLRSSFDSNGGSKVLQEDAASAYALCSEELSWCGHTTLQPNTIQKKKQKKQKKQKKKKTPAKKKKKKTPAKKDNKSRAEL